MTTDYETQLNRVLSKKIAEDVISEADKEEELLKKAFKMGAVITWMAMYDVEMDFAVSYFDTDLATLQTLFLRDYHQMDALELEKMYIMVERNPDMGA